MLYIDDVGNNTVRFASSAAGANAVYYPNTLSARSDELDLVWIVDEETNNGVLNAYNPDEITLDGVVYSAPNFVQAFNAMVAGDTYVQTTTTTTTAPVTTTTTTAA